jgi:signal peptidase I
MIKKAKLKLYSLVKKWIIPFLISCILFLLVKFYFYELKIVEKNSMEGTLKNGDIVVLNKINKFSSTVNNLDRKDIVVFYHSSTTTQTEGLKLQYIKRCVGLPGDTLRSVNNTVFCNGVRLKNPKNIQLTFKAEFNTDDSVLFLLNENGIKSALKTDKPKEWIFNATKEKALKIAGKLNVKKFQEINLLGVPNQPMFLSTLYPAWNIDNYGPIYIPKKGDSIALNVENISLYASIISQQEKNILSIRNDSLLINNEFLPFYTFKNSYCFVVGDNRYNSIDSRHFGFISESDLVAKVSFLVCSYNSQSNSFRNNRFLKSLNNE